MHPPFVLIFPVFCLLREQGVDCTIVVPGMQTLPVWWPVLKYYNSSEICLGVKGDRCVIKTRFQIRSSRIAIVITCFKTII